MKHHFADEYSKINGVLQKIDPRIKIISTVLFVLLVNITSFNNSFSLIYYTFILVLCTLLANVPLLRIFRKSLVSLPFIIFFALFSLFYHHRQPWFSGIIVVKAYLSILTMILLISTTSFSHFLKALQKLKIPVVLVMIFSFMYRYLFVITDELMNVKTAKDARTVGGSKWFHTKVLANIIGVVFISSYERSERIYQAMLSRGFDGTIRTLDDFSLKNRDYLFGVSALMIFIIIKIMEYSLR
ncbi:MAG: energy-coupling factor transporter transmembrane component T [bacterium]|nr:energy-coupling factor transporter transmembrane component T [bacterium]MDD5354821.1 energy-coupling factor transporter transmembrane component T [bacterium]MDD5756697.1 energy-coupling factor transporter transmembrane component T [bacterium]